MNSYEQSILTAKAISSKKGLNIKLIEIGDISSLADYMVIATGTSSTHVKAIADEVEYQLDEAGISVSHIEGYRSNSWILLDYVDVIVHIFSAIHVTSTATTIKTARIAAKAAGIGCTHGSCRLCPVC